jgi:hypothetical protein
MQVSAQELFSITSNLMFQNMIDHPDFQVIPETFQQFARTLHDTTPMDEDSAKDKAELMGFLFRCVVHKEQLPKRLRFLIS